MTRVLQIIPFPSVRPRDGGQIRAQQTGKVLEAAGLTLIRCPVYRAAWHPNSMHQPPVVNLDGAVGVPRYQNIWQLYDLTNGEVLANDAQCFVALKEFVERARPDVIMLEHPWLWTAIKKLPLCGRAPIIYNSYNLEAELKCRMLKDAGVADADAVAAEIESLERDLVSAAAAVSATTEADAAVYRNWASGPVVVAPNGAERRARAHLRDVLPDALRYWWRYLLFVASAHPPNGAGFAELVIGGLTSMRPDERIVVAGSVCNIIAEHPRIKDAAAMATDHLVLFGQVSSSMSGLPSGKCRGNVVADYLWWRFKSQDGRSAACRPSDHRDRESLSGLRGFHGYARSDNRGNRRSIFRSNAASTVGGGSVTADGRKAWFDCLGPDLAADC